MTEPLQTSFATTSIATLLKLLDYENNPTGQALYGLIDAAQYSNFNHKKISAIKRNALVSLLGEGAQDDAIYVGPLLLLELQQNDYSALNWLLETLKQHNFASLITSTQPLTAIAAQLSWLTDVQHDDNTEWVMRYYDPRILPHWLAVLTAEQKNLALSGIQKWLYVDASGQWQTITGNHQTNPQPQKQAMRMTSQQHELMMQKCLPYTIIEMLNEEDPALLATTPPHTHYNLIATQLTNAQNYQLDSLVDLTNYCMLALLCGADFNQHPLAKQALAAPLKASEFSQRIQAWNTQQWDAILKGEQSW